MSKLEHIFFDLDHTLWDFDKNSRLTFQKILKLNSIQIDLDHFINAYLPINLKYWKQYREEKISQTTLRYQRLKETFEVLFIEVPDQTINQLSQDYIVNLTEFNYLIPGALDVLNYLMPKYKLHIITNGFENVQEKKLIKSKLQHYFKTVTNAEMAGVKKPNAKIFKMALNLAQASPKQSVMIGDSLEADIEGALANGMAAIYYNYHQTEIKNNRKVIHHLLELKTLL